MICRTLALAAATSIVSACSAPYMLAEYAGVASSKVSVSCGQRYSAFRRADKVLIVAYPLAELVACGTEPPGPRGIRYENAAIAYAGTVPPCRVTGGWELDLLHSEFTLDCVARPVDQKRP
jgi:hypothetical protein